MFYSRTLLDGNKTLANITDLDTLSKILPGIKKIDLDQIPNNSKVDSLINIINASLKNDVQLTSVQVIKGSTIYFIYNLNI